MIFKKIICSSLLLISYANACNKEISSVVRGNKELGIVVPDHLGSTIYYDDDGVLSTAIVAHNCAEPLYNKETTKPTKVNCGPEVTQFIERATKRSEEYLKEYELSLKDADISDLDKKEMIKEYEQVLALMKSFNKLVHQEFITHDEFNNWIAMLKRDSANQSYRSEFRPNGAKESETIDNADITERLSYILSILFPDPSMRMRCPYEKKVKIDKILQAEWTERSESTSQTNSYKKSEGTK